ncbi:MAG: threonine synthase [Candidatus Poribacteria bacterium]|nr:threonine synthase [Candidatus Poribacteria bacterium]
MICRVSQALPDLRTMRYVCNHCNTSYEISPLRYKCDCGSPLTLQKDGSRRYVWDTSTPSLWRYREALLIPTDSEIVTLDEGMTPIIPLDLKENSEHYVKLDYLCPTGSYKDRGASVLLTHLKALGVTKVVEDSSGNAGAAIAAYSARAGIRCTIYCPEATSKGKLKQISAYGAELKLVPGNRMATTEAVQAAAENICYASHNWNPFFLEGTKTLAYEMTEQLKGSVPTHVICPVGFGSIYLGLYLGFQELHAAGIIDRPPRLLGVQPETCCPIYNAYRDKTPSISRMPQTAPTLAEGITAELPIRGEMILNAIRFTNGAFTTVNDADIEAGMKTLAAKGIYVEPTSAVVIKGYEKFKQEGIINDGDVTVSILTGSGLKK